MSETTTKPRPQMLAPTMTRAEEQAVGKQVARQAGGSTVARYFEAKKDSLAKLLPAHMTPDRFLRITMNALRTTPKLMDATVESLFGSTMFCAQIGLEPNTPQGHIYLIPFANKRKGVTEVQVIIGFKGLIDLARRSGQIESITSQAVYENDEFTIDYLRPEDLTHRPPRNGVRGEFIGVWARAKFKDGGEAFDYLPRADIDKIRDASQGYRTAKQYGNNNTPWITHYDEMARKTAVRRLSKYLPMSVELAAATALDERADRRASQGLHRMVEGESFDISIASAGTDEDEQADEDAPPQVPEPPAEPAAERKPRAPRQPKQEAQPEPPPPPDMGPEDEGPASVPHDEETGEIDEDKMPQTRAAGPAPGLDFGGGA